MFLERHVARLARDAAALGIEAPANDEIRAAFAELAAACARPGAIARVALIPAPSGPARIEASLRDLGPSAGARGWTAICASLVHPGPHATSACKACERAHCDAALAAARAAGADEALLFDAAGRLVEGARCNLCYATVEGAIATPPLARGAVAGIAREIAIARIPELAERDLARNELGGLRELVALNAVRGAVAITRIDARPVGSGVPGELALGLGRALTAAADEERA